MLLNILFLEVNDFPEASAGEVKVMGKRSIAKKIKAFKKLKSQTVQV